MTEKNIDQLNQENQLVISFELICLLKWLLEHEDEKIKKIIAQALRSGLHHELNDAQLKKDLLFEDIQTILLEFFDMMEVLLLESLSENAIKKALETRLLPSIEQIDSSVCDDATVRFSIEKATSKLDTKTEQNSDLVESQEEAKKILMQELLKRWKPRKKNILN